MSKLALIDEVPTAPPAGLPAGPLVEVVVPVHNEQRVLAASVTRLHRYLTASFRFPFRITIADNASTDRTWPLARELAARLPQVAAVHLDQKGRGRALRQVWSGSDAQVLAYTDVDLSTDLAALLPLVRDGDWFFDTELLVLAERAGLRIHEVPVDWVEDPDSRVAIVPTALEDLRGVARLAAGLLTGSLRTRLVALAATAAPTLLRFVVVRAVLHRPGRPPTATRPVDLERSATS